jgi:hypothetical protein
MHYTTIAIVVWRIYIPLIHPFVYQLGIAKGNNSNLRFTLKIRLLAITFFQIVPISIKFGMLVNDRISKDILAAGEV